MEIDENMVSELLDIRRRLRETLNQLDSWFDRAGATTLWLLEVPDATAINAIKLIRIITNADLKSAKRLVDEVKMGRPMLVVPVVSMQQAEGLQTRFKEFGCRTELR